MRMRCTGFESPRGAHALQGKDDRKTGSGARCEGPACHARRLILACSASKRPDPDPVPALALYDRPSWRTRRTAHPNGRRAKVALHSAHDGVRDAATPIADYDARPAQDLAERMIAGGVTTR